MSAAPSRANQTNTPATSLAKSAWPASVLHCPVWYPAGYLDPPLSFSLSLCSCGFTLNSSHVHVGLELSASVDTARRRQASLDWAAQVTHFVNANLVIYLCLCRVPFKVTIRCCATCSAIKIIKKLVQIHEHNLKIVVFYSFTIFQVSYLNSLYNIIEYLSQNFWSLTHPQIVCLILRTSKVYTPQCNRASFSTTNRTNCKRKVVKKKL